MPDRPSPEVELLRTAYAAFNARDIDAALATMALDVAWPRAFKGGFVRGHQDVRDYWAEQWAEIDPHVEPTAFHSEGGGRVLATSGKPAKTPMSSEQWSCRQICSLKLSGPSGHSTCQPRSVCL
jgi:ketosteroid isomerase-like protein